MLEEQFDITQLTDEEIALIRLVKRWTDTIRQQSKVSQSYRDNKNRPMLPFDSFVDLKIRFSNCIYLKSYLEDFYEEMKNVSVLIENSRRYYKESPPTMGADKGSLL